MLHGIHQSALRQSAFYVSTVPSQHALDTTAYSLFHEHVLISLVPEQCCPIHSDSSDIIARIMTFNLTRP
ncbi:hypothetical protein Hypma_013587 [Hypsizygus marmoreus]|uniref:Uncharacterized protein n=1 Tax=Hypsizygus marmoreus TaxID=39966 RepID=A0A369JGC8_HYPMA|nr:hypothetical protein Hypma_013587 [Hypsizygus marmoreus]